MKKIFVVSAEPSAEMYASFIIKELKKTTDIEVTGIGDAKLEEIGVTLIGRAREIAVVGAIEVLNHFFKIKQVLKKSIKWIKDNSPEMVLLFDFPDFNFLLIKRIRKFYKGKIVYIISPQIWAWRKKRKYFIKKNVDKMIVILPFEKDIYKEIGYEVDYLGHPLVDVVRVDKSPQDFKSEIGIKSDKKLITIFPGSRIKEIKNHMSVLNESINYLKKKYADIEFLFVLANEHFIDYVNSSLTNKSRVHVIAGQNYNAINASYLIIAKSGTVTLETAILEKPAVVFYKVSKLSYLFAKLLVDVKFISLPNILMNECVYPEFIQNDFNVGNITSSVERLIEDTDFYISTIERLQKIKSVLGEQGFFLRAAKKIEEWLNER
ncbi:MAG: lipid-A-disaccharide synthase [Proteobacteria bacterium]|nr:lipid-A-disaccharide synthase [Pseudomonadota bacterium]